MSLEIASYSSVSQLYDELTRFTAKEGTVIVPGAEARTSFLRAGGPLLGKERLLTLPQFWGTLAGKSAADLPEEMRAAESRIVIAALLADQPALQQLLQSSGGAEILRRSLERHAIWEKPFVGMQDEIKTAEEKLAAAGALPGARRRALARAAADTDWGGPLYFLHPPEMHPLFGHLLRGLAERNEVHLLLLGEGEALSKSLAGAGISYDLRSLRPSPQARWLLSEDVLRQAAEEVDACIKEGVSPSQIAIIFAAGGQERFLPIAEEYSLPYLWKRSRRAGETALGFLLLHPEKGNCGDLTLLQDEVDALQDGSIEDYLQIAAHCLRRSEDNNTLAEGAALVRALGSLHLALQSRGLEVHPAQAIEELATERLALGSDDGVRLLSLGESVGTTFARSVFVGLGANEYPPRQEEDPLLRAFQSQSEEVVWNAALASAGRSVFIREQAADDPGSAYWQKTCQEEEEVSLLGSPRRQAQALASCGKEVMPGLSRQLHREEIAGLTASGSTYSVTELEQYLRCPYGWFVQYQLRPRFQETAAQQLGIIAHDLLEELWNLPESDRLQELDHIFPQRTEILSDWEREALRPRIERIMENYSGELWPFSRSLAEQELKIVIPDGEGVERTILGRADRLDFREGADEREEVLVIDYKNRRPSSHTAARLQPFLYPLMAAWSTGAEPLGFLYLSIAHGSAEGHLRYPMAGLEHLPLDWNKKKDAALLKTQEAIYGIEGGEWNIRGKNCGRSCPHHLLGDRS